MGFVGLVLLTSACGGSSGFKSPVTPGVGASSASTKTTASPPSGVAETPATIAPKPADTLLGTYVPVSRNGKAVAPTMSAPPAAFSKPVHYVDGTTLQVTSINHGQVSGQGAGIFPGQPTTTFGLRLTNGSRKTIDLNQVVVTAAYGSPKRVASPEYSASAHDFVGSAVPGASLDATYAFSIPTANLGGVVMLVDFDGVHVSATFTGAAR